MSEILKVIFYTYLALNCLVYVITLIMSIRKRKITKHYTEEQIYNCLKDQMIMYIIQAERESLVFKDIMTKEQLGFHKKQVVLEKLQIFAAANNFKFDGTKWSIEIDAYIRNANAATSKKSV